MSILKMVAQFEASKTLILSFTFDGRKFGITY